LLLLLWAGAFGRPVRRADVEPTVTVLIPAYNEAGAIGATLEAMLAQDYPPEMLEIVVVSDASDDGTDEIVAGFVGRGVALLRQAQRGGKALALNAAVARARGEIVVFADANSRFAPTAVRSLACNFADPSVGYVTGSLTLESHDRTVSGAGGSAYK